MTRHVCIWTEDPVSFSWESECGGLFYTIDGTPAENGMRFCPYCGGRLEAVAATDDDGEDDETTGGEA